MVAPHYREQPPRVGKVAFFDILDPGAVYADRHLVLGFARDRAGVAADTLPVVDYEAEIHIRVELLFLILG